MKKLILLGALSVLFYSAPGYTGGREEAKAAEKAAKLRSKGFILREAGALKHAKEAEAKVKAAELRSKGFMLREAGALEHAKEAEAEADPAAALARLEASVQEFEAQAIPFCKQLVTDLQAWEQKAGRAYAEATAAKKFIVDRMWCNPLSQLTDKPFDVRDGLEYVISDRANHIESITRVRAQAAQAAAVSAQTNCGAEAAQAEAAAPVAVADAYSLEIKDPEVKKLHALCFRIREEFGSIPSGWTRQEIKGISKRILGEVEEKLDQMEQAYSRFWNDEVRYQQKVMAFVDAGQERVQQSFADVDVGEWHGPFFKEKAAKFDVKAFDKVHSTVDLAEDLLDRATALFSRVNTTADAMRAQYPKTINFFAQMKQAEEEKEARDAEKKERDALAAKIGAAAAKTPVSDKDQER